MLSTLFTKSSSADTPPEEASPPPSVPTKQTLLPRSSAKMPGWIFLPTVVTIVAILYWAQQVLVPIAVALLLTFVLNPVVSALERLRLGRVVSVVIATVFSFSILLSVGWIVAWQIAALANDLPQYRKNIQQKVADLREFKRGGALQKVEQTVEEVKKELNKPETAAREPAPRPVVVASDQRSVFWPIPLATGPIVERLAGAVLAIVLVIFMLIQREELRNRLIRVSGYGRLTITTKAMEEAGQKISHYLLAQLLINSGFGLAIGVILFFLGVPYALLWGFLATMLRFIPYVGPWAAALLPTALSLAYFPGWMTSLIIVGSFLAIELIINFFLEPRLYGESAGVSEIAVLVMAAFWTWLWGPVGLVLATPLTVCLVVFAKYVPEMAFVTVLLSDAPALETYVNFYQRMLANDQDEGEEIVEEYLQTHSITELCDDVFIPALSRGKSDRRRDQLSEKDQKSVHDSTRAILEDLDDRQAAAKKSPEKKLESVEPAAPPSDQVFQIFAFPADGEADEIALLALAKLLDSRRYPIDVASPNMLAAEVVALVEEKQPRLVCIGAIAPGGLVQARYLCKRIRARCADVKILVGRWNFSGSLEYAQASLTSVGADRVVATLSEARDQLSQLVQLTADDSSLPAPKISESNQLTRASA